MRTIILSTVISLYLSASAVLGSPIFSDSFSYPDGNLVGQGGWSQQGSTVTSPIQVTSEGARLGSSGQDGTKLLNSTLTLSSGTTFYYGLKLNVSSAGTGDYFLNFLSAANSSFFGRVYVKATGGGFVLGYLEAQGGIAVATYGSTVLGFNTDYRVVVAYNSLSGALNNSAAVYVDPSNTGVESANSAYLTDSWTSSTAEPGQVTALVLRQGDLGSAPSILIDDLSAGTLFSDAALFPTVTPVPEVSVIGVVGFGVIALGYVVRRRR